jgi:hypothetical protein
MGHDDDAAMVARKCCRVCVLELGILKVIEAEAFEILDALGASLLQESFPAWFGDPCNPSTSR